MSLDYDCQLCDDKCYEFIKIKKLRKIILKPHIFYDYRCICLECWYKWQMKGKRITYVGEYIN